MIYRDFQDLHLSLLGFGTMRLPTTADGAIDFAALRAAIVAAALPDADAASVTVTYQAQANAWPHKTNWASLEGGRVGIYEYPAIDAGTHQVKLTAVGTDVIVTVTLMIPQAIFTEAFLSFIGIGISAPMASLGTLAQDAKMLMNVYPMQMVWPVLVICIVIFSLNFIGEGLETALNPRGKR